MGQTRIYIVCGCVSKQSGLRSKKNSICVPVNTYKKPSVPAERGEEIVKRQTTMAKELCFIREENFVKSLSLKNNLTGNSRVHVLEF